MRSNKEANRRLHWVAEAQAGFFTAKQAQSAGFSPSSHTYHVQQGDWVREQRGIYRLASFPEALRPELTRWHLWSMDRSGRAQGVYSHSTALGLYLTPQKRRTELHMTVPKGFRRSGGTPEGLTLYYADLPKGDIAEGRGFRVTTALRTILDLAVGSGAAPHAVPRRELSKALLNILERRLITRAQVRSAKVPEAYRLVLEELLG